MTRKHLASWGIVVVLLVSLFGTAAAQSETDPSATPTPEPTSEESTIPAQPSKFYTHPVVQILSAYFGREIAAPVDPNATPTEPPVVDPNATPEPTAVPQTAQEMMAEEIAAYHEQGMGFGVLVKLYAMAEASQLACPTTPTTPTDPAAAPADGTAVAPTCTAMTVDNLVTAFKGGSGMGALFKEYGKPALLGVGHVKQAMKKLNQQGTLTPYLKGNQGNGNGHKK